MVLAVGCAPAPTPVHVVEIPPPTPETAAPAPAAPRTAEERCDAGDAQACDDLGERCTAWKTQDLPRAHRLLRRSCEELKDARGCYDLGEMVLTGLGVASDQPRALALLDRACDGRFTGACKELGTLYIEGIVAGDYRPDPRGAVYMRRACEMDDAEACLYYGDFLQHGRGVAPDALRAGEYFRRSCKKGDQRGCDAAAGRR
jgi:uncharacterized protein